MRNHTVRCGNERSVVHPRTKRTVVKRKSASVRPTTPCFNYAATIARLLRFMLNFTPSTNSSKMRMSRAEAESATFSRRLAEALVRNDEDDLGCDRARMEEMRDERDALKAQEGEWADQISAALNSTADKTGRTPSMIAGRVQREREELEATKEEIATLKARLADLSEADEELHTCRALVNATSENLSVDLERMVDDLAEANEKAARSEKDSHSWHELYKDTKAKLAALVSVVSTWQEWGGHCETCEFVRQRAANPEMDTALFADYCDCGWYAAKGAIAAARGGVS